MKCNKHITFFRSFSFSTKQELRGRYYFQVFQGKLTSWCQRFHFWLFWHFWLFCQSFCCLIWNKLKHFGGIWRWLLILLNLLCKVDRTIHKYTNTQTNTNKHTNTNVQTNIHHTLTTGFFAYACYKRRKQLNSSKLLTPVSANVEDFAEEEELQQSSSIRSTPPPTIPNQKKQKNNSNNKKPIR